MFTLTLPSLLTLSRPSPLLCRCPRPISPSPLTEEPALQHKATDPAPTADLVHLPRRELSPSPEELSPTSPISLLTCSLSLDLSSLAPLPCREISAGRRRAGSRAYEPAEGPPPLELSSSPHLSRSPRRGACAAASAADPAPAAEPVPLPYLELSPSPGVVAAGVIVSSPTAMCHEGDEQNGRESGARDLSRALFPTVKHLAAYLLCCAFLLPATHATQNAPKRSLCLLLFSLGL